MNNSGDTPGALALGIEIGGTKLQVGVGTTGGKLIHAPVRRQVQWEHGAMGILQELTVMAAEALTQAGHSLPEIKKIGIGFGGVLDANRGVILRSYQIAGWDGFPLRQWAEDRWGKPVVIQNDASTAGLAEALHGNGRGYNRVFYMTIGSGIGGGWIVDGRIDNGQGLGAAEVGHTWVNDPGSRLPVELEQFCSGWAIGTRARQLVGNTPSLMTDLAGSPDAIDARIVHAAAKQGDELALNILHETCQALGIAIANVIALLHPQRVIIGGGISLMGALFWDDLRNEVTVRSMPVFLPGVEIVRAALGEEVVLSGALSL